MGDSSPPPPPAPVVPPTPPTPAALTAESLQAQLDAAPKILAENQQLLPQYAQLQTDIAKAQAPQQAQLNLSQQQVYGPQLIDAALANVKRADPTGFQIREDLGAKTMAELAAGGDMTAKELTQAQDAIRSGQIARGGGTGLGDTMQEALGLNIDRFGRNQQREANAASFLAGKTPVPQAASLNPSGAPESPNVGSFASMAPSTAQIMGYGMQSAQLGSQNANAANNLANNQWQYIDQNTSNPFLTGLAGFGGFAAGMVGAAAGGGGSGFNFGSGLMGAAGGQPQSGQYMPPGGMVA